LSQIVTLASPVAATGVVIDEVPELVEELLVEPGEEESLELEDESLLDEDESLELEDESLLDEDESLELEDESLLDDDESLELEDESLDVLLLQYPPSPAPAPPPWPRAFH
jgi:hypothetical protein